MSAATIPAYRKHGFTLCLLGAVALALLCPAPGAGGGLLRPEWTTKLGVCLIFLLLGVSLPMRELAAGYRPIRLHAFVLGWNYLCFPLVTLCGLLVFGRFLAPDLVLGFGLLSIMPTTIASAVAFTDLAGGRTANALCATVLSNLLGVVLVPLWVALYLKTGESVALPLVPLLVKLAWLVVAPLLAGQCLRVLWKASPRAMGAWPRRVSSAIIVYIVYTAFAESVASGYFGSMSFRALGAVLAGAALLCAAVSLLVWQSAKCLSVDPGQRIAAFFCASQKSLATGLPLATAVLAALPPGIEVTAGALLLPLIVYHPLQLVLASIWGSKRDFKANL